MEDDICVKTSHSRWTSLRKKKGLQLISGGREQWNTMGCRVLRVMKLSRPMPGMGFRQDGKAKRKEICLLRFYKDAVLNYKNISLGRRAVQRQTWIFDKDTDRLGVVFQKGLRFLLGFPPEFARILKNGTQ